MTQFLNSASFLVLIAASGSAMAHAGAETAVEMPTAVEIGAELAEAGGAAGVGAEAGDYNPFANDIVITARRRAERIQDVPVAANAFGGELLEATRTYNLRDLQALTPSLSVSVTNPRNTAINIRGLGNSVSVRNDGLEPAVGVYSDQVYLGRPGQAVFDLADIERIEVLRGPQGTLFGKNTSSGAVVVTTKAPVHHFEFGGDVTLANYDYRQFHAYANIPLVEDVLATRLYVSKTDRDGNVHNVYDNSKTNDYHDFGFRGQLLFTPKDSIFKLRLIADYGYQRAYTAASVRQGVITQYDNGAPLLNNFNDRAERLGYTPPTIQPGERIVDINGAPYYRMRQGGINAIADLEFANHTLTSVTAYRQWDWYPHNDGDGTPLDVNRAGHQSNNQNQFSQELRIATTGDRKIDYVAGLYYFRQSIYAESVSHFGVDAPAWNTQPSVSAAVADAALNDYYVLGLSKPETNSYAAFAQAIWHVTPTLDLTGGLRYTYERKTGWFNQTVSGQSLSHLTEAEQLQAETIRSRFGKANSFEATSQDGRLSGQLTLSWKPQDGTLVYATYARGNKFGGLNLSDIVTTGAYAANPVIRPETITTYEIGLKTSLFDNVLTANFAGFWNDVNDFQTTFIDYERNNQTFFTNAGSVRTRGVEVDLRANPARWLSLYGSSAYTDAKYGAYANAPCPIEITGQTACDLSGRTLPNVPKWTLSGGGEVRTDANLLGGENEVYFGGDVSYRSSSYSAVNLSRYALIPAYSLTNLRAGVRSNNGKYDLQFWVRNLFDNAYYQSIGASNTGLISATYGDPRTYGLTLKANF